MCEKGTVYLYDNPIDGTWLYCTVCGFSGDPVELFERVFHHESLDNAIQDMQERGLFQSGSFPVGPAVGKYKRSQVGIRRQVSDFFQVAYARTRGVGITQGGIRLMQGYNLWTGYEKERWEATIGRFMGEATKKEIFDLPLTASNLMTTNVRQGPWGSALVLPRYDLPGRIRGLHLFAPNAVVVKELNIRPGGATTYSDSGLGLLDTLDPGGDREVFAIGNEFVALQLQLRRLSYSGTPIPMVVYDEHTNEAWRSVQADRVIFWNYTLGTSMFYHAMRVEGGHVATSPLYDKGVTPRLAYDMCRAESDAIWLEEVRKSASHWPAALCRYLMDNQVRAPYILSDLQPKEHHYAMILEACPAADKDKIREFMSLSRVGRYFEYEGMKLIETPEGFFEKPPQGRGVRGRQVSNVRVVPHTNIRFPSSGRVRTTGFVMVGDQKIPFDVDQRDIEKDPYKWLQGVVMDAGLPQPVVAKKFRKAVFDVGQVQHRPETVRVPERTGWVGQMLSLPNVCVEGGIVSQGSEHAYQNEKTPTGRTIGPEPPPDQTMENLFQDDELSGIFWAFLAALLRNLLAPIKGWEVAPICVIGERSNPTYQHLLTQFDIPNINARALQKGLEKLPDTDFPVSLSSTDGARTFKTCPFLDLFANKTRSNIVFSVSRAFAVTGSLAGSATFVNMGEDTHPMIRLKGAQNIIPQYVAWLQEDEYATVSCSAEPLRAILASLRDWGRTTYQNIGEFESGISAARALAYTPNRELASSLGCRFLGAVRWLVDRKMFPDPEPDDHGVKISLWDLTKACELFMIPVPPYDQIIDSLADGKELTRTRHSTIWVSPEAWERPYAERRP